MKTMIELAKAANERGMHNVLDMETVNSALVSPEGFLEVKDVDGDSHKLFIATAIYAIIGSCQDKNINTPMSIGESGRPSLLRDMELKSVNVGIPGVASIAFAPKNFSET